MWPLFLDLKAETLGFYFERKTKAKFGISGKYSAFNLLYSCLIFGQNLAFENVVAS